MMVPVHTLRAVFALSVFACSFIFALFVRGRVTWTDAFWVQLIAAAFVVCVVICFIAFRQGRMRLKAVPLAVFASVFFPQLAIVYIALAAGITLLVTLAFYVMTASVQSSVALAVITGLWLSLWLAPGVASLTSWRKLRALHGTAD